MKKLPGRNLVLIPFLFAPFLSPPWAPAAEEPRNPETRLVAYLARAQGEPGEKESVLRALAMAQVITLEYKKTAPIRPEDLEREGRIQENCSGGSAYASDYIPVFPDGKRYAEITLVFNAFQFAPEQWLRTMKRPIQAGYELRKASIVLIPDVAVRRQTFAKCQAMARAFRDKLEAMKPDFGQLRSLGPGTLKPGKWNENGWPDYPDFLYRHDIGYPGPGKESKKDSKEWCEISLQLHSVTGVPGQPAAESRGREYPMQGLTVSWRVSSADPRFDERITKVLEVLVGPLDDFEKKLQGK